MHSISDSEDFTVKVSLNPLIVKLDNIPTLIFLLDLVTSIVCESEIYSDNFLSKSLFGKVLVSTINIVQYFYYFLSESFTSKKYSVVMIIL